MAIIIYIRDLSNSDFRKIEELQRIELNKFSELDYTNNGSI